VDLLFVLLIVIKFFILFLKTVLGLGLGLLFLSVIITFLVYYVVNLWYGFIFYLIYIGGILVLFIYISCLRFKPRNNFSLKNYFGFILFISICKFSYYFLNDSQALDYSLNLFNSFEKIFILFLIFVLFLVLWLITKLIFRKKGSLRPFF